MRYADRIQAEAACEDAKMNGYYSAKIEKEGEYYALDLGKRGDRTGDGKLNELERDNEELRKELEQLKSGNKRTSKKDLGIRVAKGIFNGLGRMNENYEHPENRLKISRTPAKRSEIPIASRQTVSPISGRNAGLKRHHISNAPRPE